MLVSPEILYVLGGESYLAAKYVMPPITMGLICQSIYTIYVNVEQFCKKTIGMAIGSVTAAIINYILNAIFIPIFGYTAAAYTTLASFMWLLIVHMFIVHRLGMSYVYHNKRMLLIVAVLMVITVGINFAYQYLTIRIILMALYLLSGVILLLKNKSKLLQIVKIVKK